MTGPTRTGSTGYKPGADEAQQAETQRTNEMTTVYAVYVSADQAYVQSICADQGKARQEADRLVAETLVDRKGGFGGFSDEEIDDAFQKLQVPSLDQQTTLARHIFGWYAEFDYLVCEDPDNTEDPNVAMVVKYEVEQ